MSFLIGIGKPADGLVLHRPGSGEGEGLDVLVPGLRTEARQKLSAIRPASFGQASRISGVSPADIAALMICAERRKEKA